MQTLIVSEHPGAWEWLRKHHAYFFGSVYMGGEAKVVPLVNITPELVRGNRIVGLLPDNMIEHCIEYWRLTRCNGMPLLRTPDHGLTCLELEQFQYGLVREV